MNYKDTKFRWAICDQTVRGNSLDNIKLPDCNIEHPKQYGRIVIVHAINSSHDSDKCDRCAPVVPELKYKMCVICAHHYNPTIISKPASLINIQGHNNYGKTYRICYVCLTLISSNAAAYEPARGQEPASEP